MVYQDQIQQIIMLTNLTEGEKASLLIYFPMKKKSVNCMVGIITIVLTSNDGKRHHFDIMIVIKVSFQEKTN